MFKDCTRDPSRLDDEYFYKKDRELIDKMKETEQKKQEFLERTQHHHKCAKCGHGMEERIREELSLLFCKTCESVHMNVKTLEGLGHHGRLRNLLNELQEHLISLKETA